MDPASVMLGWLLVAQAASVPGAGAGPAAAAAAKESQVPSIGGLAPPIASKAEPEAGPAARASAAEIVAGAFAAPDSGTLAGRPVTLLEALASARDKARQLAAVHKYWRLAEAVGEYAAQREAAEQLRRLEPRGADAAAVRSARASALAALEQAETAAAAAQRELAEAAVLALNLPLPLPADVPHAGPYRTRFDELYAARSVSPRARLIHRTLPVRREAIDRRVQAVTAADYAMEGATSGYALGEADLMTVLDTVAELARQRRALVAAVAQYNHDIVDYVLMVVDPPPSAAVLVSMLLKPNPETFPPAAAPQQPGGIVPPLGTIPLNKQGSIPESSGVQPATFLEPPAPKYVPRYGEPGPPVWGEPTLAPPKERPSPQTVRRANADGPRLPPEGGLPSAGGLALAGSPATSGLYTDLAALPPGTRAKKLCEALHAAGTLTTPPQGGQAIELKDYLRTLVGGDRRGAIEAYWLAAERAAKCRALQQQVQWLRELGPLALDRGGRPGGSGQMLRLHAAQRAGEADLLDAQVGLLEAQFELTRRAGRPLDSAWLLPATPPHAGPYDLKLDARPKELVQSRPARRLAAVIPALGASIQEQAGAVVEVDSARAAAAAAFVSKTGLADSPLPSIRCQTAQTLAFLETLTAYNRAIAEYVLLVLDPAIPADQLVQTLVVAK